MCLGDSSSKTGVGCAIGSLRKRTITVAIPRRTLHRFLSDHLLPEFSKEWIVHGGDCLLRLSGHLAQAIWFYPSRYSDDFRPAYSVNVLPELSDFLHATLGSHLKNPSGGDMWLAWTPEQQGFVTELVRAIRAQARPHIDEPLTLETVADYILRHHVETRKRPTFAIVDLLRGSAGSKGAHFAALWSLGIIYGLQGRLGEARRHFEATEQQFRSGVEHWKKRGKPVPLSLHDDLERLTRLKSHLTDAATFAAYCAQETARVKRTLKLSDLACRYNGHRIRVPPRRARSSAGGPPGGTAPEGSGVGRVRRGGGAPGSRFLA